MAKRLVRSPYFRRRVTPPRQRHRPLERGLREPTDAVGGRSFMVQLAWPPAFGGLLEAKYRTLDNESYTPPEYRRAHALEVLYSRSLNDLYFGGEVHVGRDVFGESYSRVGAFIRF